MPSKKPMTFHKPTYKRFAHIMEQAHKPYDRECYDWTLVGRLMEEAGVPKREVLELIHQIKYEVFG